MYKLNAPQNVEVVSPGRTGESQIRQIISIDYSKTLNCLCIPCSLHIP